MTVNTAKKGITAVVAIVLLLMMTVAAAGLAYMWISQMQTGAQAQGTEQLGKISSSAQTSFSIDSVRNSAPVAGTIAVDVRNTGTRGLTNLGGAGASLYVYTTTGGVEAGGKQATTMGFSGVTIQAGAVATIATAVAYPTAVGDKVRIKLITPDSITIEFTCRAKSVGVAGAACEGY